MGESQEEKGARAELEGASESEKKQDRFRKKGTETQGVAGGEQEKRLQQS